ncbi:hypothetical protein K438DRAFT_1785820 [Mycena galopus ATCC 62051]|nr:hypothetical protein K438DRAFT_1785820 [Mycena galopus ATCC 62051]
MSAHAHRKRTGNGEKDADPARVPVACGKRRGGKTRARTLVGAAVIGRRCYRGARTLKRGRGARSSWSTAPAWRIRLDESFRTAAQAEHAEREEDTEREPRTGYRTEAGYTRKASARAGERASGEESGLREGTAEDGRDVIRTHARWRYKGGREICTGSGMRWNTHIDTGGNME